MSLLRQIVTLANAIVAAPFALVGLVCVRIAAWLINHDPRQ